MTTTPSHALQGEISVPQVPVGPVYAPTSPTSFVGLGARMVADSRLSTTAAQRVMDRLQQIALRVATEATDAVLSATHEANITRVEEMENEIRVLPSTLGYISRDLVLATIRKYNRPART